MTQTTRYGVLGRYSTEERTLATQIRKEIQHKKPTPQKIKTMLKELHRIQMYKVRRSKLPKLRKISKHIIETITNNIKTTSSSTTQTKHPNDH